MSTPLTLALDAATYGGSVAVVAGGRLLAECEVAMRGEREERLMPAVASALDAAGVTVAAIERIVCGAGPGSFTSLRIAGSIAKGIATVRGIPLLAVSSLALIVGGSDGALEAGRYLAVLDAMRGEAYVAPVLVRPGGEVEEEGAPAVVPRDAVARMARDAGALAIGPAESLVAPPRARGVLRLERTLAAAEPVSLDAWEPSYGRLAEAQVQWERRHGRPLHGA